MQKPELQTADFCFEHPLGAISGWFSNKGLCSLVLPRSKNPPLHIKVLHSPVNDGRVRALGAALERYFSGRPESFDDIPLDFGECTAFQRNVWNALRAIPWGHTVTYGDLSKELGYGRRASRAVGQAVGRNPLLIVVPCHRVLASDGLGGFGAGLAWKRALLRLEGIEA
ncbi:MAG TPA: methylated-DNA--[protein]-cysteine S-methyltransferase [Candidatus Hydrogenedentes bacterium]|nr:methylated-DNA--[protein]-cysteine S-methyltransferase [Candidatus Hydrogenedentota bacterium]HQH66782.1 methylated-DNA--[protein]-cysteine S-methyltransferase [Candidatus Hydrogenedentota bacterium]HQM50383.1 methylated-DNA--[protein]-cysteine S-methyltransferase [Candidatus Hydrogenedentota bacterium]